MSSLLQTPVKGGGDGNSMNSRGGAVTSSPTTITVSLGKASSPSPAKSMVHSSSTSSLHHSSSSTSIGSRASSIKHSELSAASPTADLLAAIAATSGRIDRYRGGAMTKANRFPEVRPTTDIASPGPKYLSEKTLLDYTCASPPSFSFSTPARHFMLQSKSTSSLPTTLTLQKSSSTSSLRGSDGKKLSRSKTTASLRAYQNKRDAEARGTFVYGTIREGYLYLSRPATSHPTVIASPASYQPKFVTSSTVKTAPFAALSKSNRFPSNELFVTKKLLKCQKGGASPGPCYNPQYWNTASIKNKLHAATTHGKWCP